MMMTMIMIQLTDMMQLNTTTHGTHDLMYQYVIYFATRTSFVRCTRRMCFVYFAMKVYCD